MTHFKPKPKVCQYSLCGLTFIPKRLGQKTCENPENGYECSREYGKEKAAIKAEKEKDTLIKAYKENNKTLGDYKTEFQDDYINVIARLIDKGQKCISSGATNYTMHAGHYFSVGANDNIRFHLLNIYAQSLSDNHFKSGNDKGYKSGLIETFGIDLLEEIEGLPLKHHEIRIRKVDIVEAKIIAAEVIRELEKENKVYTTSERIEIRRAINKRLNIYK